MLTVLFAALKFRVAAVEIVILAVPTFLAVTLPFDAASASPEFDVLK